MNWTKEKPDKPCVFITRDKFKDKYEYAVWVIRKLDSMEDDKYYLGLLDGNGDEWGSLEDLGAGEYLIIDYEPEDK